MRGTEDSHGRHPRVLLRRLCGHQPATSAPTSAGAGAGASRATVLNLMGGRDIDRNDAELSGPLTNLNVYSFMGGSELRVPHGVDVHVSGFALMGGNEVKLGDEVAPLGAPTMDIRLVSIMGGSEVARGHKPTKEERRRERLLRKARRRDLGP